MFMFLVHVFAVIGVISTIYIIWNNYTVYKMIKEIEEKYDDFELEYVAPLSVRYRYTKPDDEE